MKVVVSLLAVVVLLLGFSLWTNTYLTNSTDKMVGQLKQIESAVESSNWEKAKSDLAKLKSSWVVNKKTWQVLLDHHEIDSIDISLSRVNKMVENRDTSNTLPEMAVLKLLVMHIPDKESFRLENIL